MPLASSATPSRLYASCNFGSAEAALESTAMASFMLPLLSNARPRSTFSWGEASAGSTGTAFSAGCAAGTGVKPVVRASTILSAPTVSNFFTSFRDSRCGLLSSLLPPSPKMRPIALKGAFKTRTKVLSPFDWSSFASLEAASSIATSSGVIRTPWTGRVGTALITSTSVSKATIRERFNITDPPCLESQTSAQHVRDVEQGWAKNDDEHRREEQSSEWQQEFERGFLRCLLCTLTTLGAQTVGIDAHCARDRSTKTIRLDQHADEAVQILDAGSLGKVTQCLTAFTTDTDFEVGELKLLTDVRMHSLQLIADLQHRSVQAESCFHRDDHEVERISESPGDSEFAFRDEAVEYESRPQETHTEC